jgi:hypothetical protein
MTTEEIISKYKDMLDGLSCLPGEPHLEVDNAARPVQQLPRRIPKGKGSQRPYIYNADIITKVTEPTPWINSMVVIEKPD